MKTETVNVPTVLEQKLFGTPITHEIKLSRRELQTVFYIGRKIELIGCYLPMKEPSNRTVKAHRSYGYEMLKDDGRTSYLRHEAGETILGVTPAGNGFTEIKILDANDELAAHYRL
jgi:hypothetical protein